MHISFTAHDPKNYGTSSGGQISYLTKENYLLDADQEYYFFNAESDTISKDEAINLIDENKGSHSNSQSKFYMLNISPSKSELEHMEKIVEKSIGDTIFESEEEYMKAKDIGMKELMKDYTNDIMKEYASNFDRDIGVEDLVFVATIEKDRTHKHNDKYVLHNKNIDKQISENPSKKRELENLYKRENSGSIIREGNKKEGLQYHSHVIVSRYEKNGNAKDKRSFSPLSKGKKSKGLNNSKVGFNRDTFFEKSQQSFDEKFKYKRPEHEKYETYKKGKNKDKNTTLSKATNEIKNYYYNMVKDVLKDANLINSKPVTPQAMLNDLSFRIKEKLGVNHLNNPLKGNVKSVKEIINMTDKGIDTGY